VLIVVTYVVAALLFPLERLFVDCCWWVRCCRCVCCGLIAVALMLIAFGFVRCFRSLLLLRLGVGAFVIGDSLFGLLFCFRHCVALLLFVVTAALLLRYVDCCVVLRLGSLIALRCHLRPLTLRVVTLHLFYLLLLCVCYLRGWLYVVGVCSSLLRCVVFLLVLRWLLLTLRSLRFR
jgi:hypothetical protein